MKTGLWSRCLKSICYQKVTDAKNFILDFIRPRMTLNCGEISFENESWTYAIFESESELICLIAKCCVTWVRNDNS